jgi:hypothetical protein
MLWTIWIERNDLAFNSNKWDVKKVQQTTWQGLLAYARNVWEKALKKAEKAYICGKFHDKFKLLWTANKLLYHKLNTRKMMWIQRHLIWV